MTDCEKWTAHRIKEDERLYEKYGKPLEKEHTGEYAANHRPHAPSPRIMPRIIASWPVC